LRQGRVGGAEAAAAAARVERPVPDKEARPVPPGMTARVRARSSGRRLRLRLGCAACVAAILLVIGAAPADAHLVDTNAMPTNYRTRILAVRPTVQGLRVRVAEIGGALELINGTGRQVIVLGTRLEPYLRVQADGGVDENRRWPARWPLPTAGRSGRRRRPAARSATTSSSTQ
jgi:hypothetical protein